MTDTLFQAILELGMELGGSYSGTASGGTTTTIVDTNIGGDDDDWNGGTALIVDDASGTDIEGVFSVISDYVSSTGTITVSDTLAAAVANGDEFVLIPPKYPLSMLRNAINRELGKIKIPQVDTSSVTIADEQTEYNLPAACHDLRQVYIQLVDDDTNDNRWREINWTLEITDTGTADKLVLDRQYGADYDLKLVYVTRHPRLWEDSDEFNEMIEIERLIPGSAAFCLRTRYYHYNDADDFVQNEIKRYLEMAERYKTEYQLRLPPVSGNVVSISRVFEKPRVGDI